MKTTDQKNGWRPAGIVLLWTLILGEALACSCRPRSSDPADPDSPFAQTDAVFSATIVEATYPERARPADGYRYEYQAHHVWKGDVAGAGVLRSPAHTCGIRLEVGKRYLIHAGTVEPGGARSTGLCSGTQRFDRALRVRMQLPDPIQVFDDTPLATPTVEGLLAMLAEHGEQTDPALSALIELGEQEALLQWLRQQDWNPARYSAEAALLESAILRLGPMAAPLVEDLSFLEASTDPDVRDWWLVIRMQVAEGQARAELIHEAPMSPRGSTVGLATRLAASFTRSGCGAAGAGD